MLQVKWCTIRGFSVFYAPKSRFDLRFIPLFSVLRAKWCTIRGFSVFFASQSLDLQENSAFRSAFFETDALNSIICDKFHPNGVNGCIFREKRAISASTHKMDLRRSSVQSGTGHLGQRKRQRTFEKSAVLSGARSGTRTLGTLIKSQVLYQLS